MSSTTPVLLRGLVDDAAVFPPAETPLPQAISAHAVHRSAWYAGSVGPLLVPTASVAELLSLREPHAAPGHEGLVSADAGPGPHASLDVVLVARPGADPATVTAGLDAVHGSASTRVVGAELAWEEGWRELGLDDLRLALEVPRGPDHLRAVADVAAAVAEGRGVVTKFRTGPTPTWPWPDEPELAGFITEAVRQGAPFKLTGGLHHVVRGTYEVGGVPEENHGLLNVLLATAAAIEGADAEEVAALLALRDRGALADVVAAWPEATGAGVRATFTAYGCCTVTDPISELADVGLLDPPPQR